MVTLNKFANEEDEWNLWEGLQIYGKIALSEENGNYNPALWRIGSKDRDGIYLAVSDGKGATQFNISDLSTIEQLYSANGTSNFGGCAHWMREVGTDNSINFQVRKSFTGTKWVEILR